MRTLPIDLESTGTDCDNHLTRPHSGPYKVERRKQDGETEEHAEHQVVVDVRRH